MLICRTCLAAENLTSIFKNYNSIQITSATGITVQENDGLPQMICQACNNLMKSSLKLREQSQYTERILREQLKLCIKQENMQRTEITDSENAISHFRQPNVLKIISKTKVKLEKQSTVYEGNETMTKHNECKSKNTQSTSENETRLIKSENQISTINIKIENISEISEQDNADTTEERLQEITQKLHVQETSNPNLELEQMYKILDEDLAKSKRKYKKNINVQKILQDDDILDSLSPDLQSIFSNNPANNSVKKPIMSKKPFPKQFKEKVKQKRPMPKQDRDEAKLAKLWSLAVKPIDRTKLIQCSICTKRYKYCYFPTHASIHFEKEFTCEVCGDKFVHVYALRFHQQRKHGAARRHSCSQCDYTAVNREELLNHENRVHTGLRPFICDVCGEGYSSKRLIYQHMRVHFGVKKYKCEYCPKMYKSTSQLAGHRSHSHLFLYVYLCYACPYKSPHRDTVRSHLVKIHGIPKDEQPKLKYTKEKR